MKTIKQITIAAFALFIVGVIGFGSTTLHAQALIQPGEELTYRVSYLGITLGTIKTVVEPITTLDGKKSVKVKVHINSSPSIPFVSLHSIYESWMDANMMYSMKFNANTQNDAGTWDFDQYLFDYDAGKLVMEKYKGKEKSSSKNYDIKKKYNDGSSLLFAARRLLYAKKSLRIPTTIMDDTVNTVINFSGKQEAAEIDAVNYPVKCVYFSGEANWTGIYGISGTFEGWFSDDEARVPIKAKMKVYVGNALIELMQWKRANWQPPKAE